MSKKLPPAHPGEILREEFMLPMGLSSNALAKALGVTPARINEIVREKRGITADTALRLARYFGTDVQSWLNLQQQYDVHCAEDMLGKVLATIRPFRGTRGLPESGPPTAPRRRPGPPVRGAAPTCRFCSRDRKSVV